MAEITLNGLYVYGSFNGGSMYISEIKAGGDEVILNKIAPEYIDNVLFVDFGPKSPYGYQLITDISYEELLEAFNSGLCIIGRIYDGNGDLKYTTKNINIEHVIIESI